MSQQSVLKWLCVGFTIGFVGVVGCHFIAPLQQTPTPTAPCRLVPLIAGPCVDPKEA